MEKLDAIILAGGKGTRLQSIISDLPKPLAPVNDKPFLEILLSQLNTSGCIKRVILSVGYKAEIILKRYSNCHEYNFEIVFSVEKNPLDTGGAIKKAIGLTDSEKVLVLNGDSFTEVNIKDLIRNFLENDGQMMIVLKQAADVGRYGNVNITDKNKIIGFEEKTGQGKGFINAGIYLFNRNLFDMVEEDKRLSMEKDLFPVFLKFGAYGYLSNGKFIDIGTPESYQSAEKYLKEI